jgi:hypothetical protein
MAIEMPSTIFDLKKFLMIFAIDIIFFFINFSHFKQQASKPGTQKLYHKMNFSQKNILIFFQEKERQDKQNTCCDIDVLPD